jgi:hypothetical protein
LQHDIRFGKRFGAIGNDLGALRLVIRIIKS